MIHIQNIEIKNFKSIRHAKIDDCKRINVFIGYPNVGKSNILEAMCLISYLSNRSNHTSYKNLCRFKELIDIFSDGDREKKSELVTEGFLFELEYVNKNDVDFSIKDINLDNRKVKITTPEIAAGIIKGVDIVLSMNKSGVLSHRSGKWGNNYEKPVLKKYQFGHSGFNSQQDPKVLGFPYGPNLSEVIRHNVDLRRECGELFSNYNLKLVFDESGNIIIQKQLDEFSAFQFSISQVADTLQRLIFHKAAILTNKNSILLFEEPEAHMFPPYISKFTSDIMYDGNNNQFFITTHSPFVINDLMENLKKEDFAIFAVGYKKETGETILKRITDEEIHEMYQYGIDVFLNLENYLPHEQ
jgi:AAA15 family ATPase/GTPase